ncbi:ABC transporter ATP-binding protein [Granulosicoccus sp. 3-233]|uniref:ABC transporter ATP-binding protein n=1 Tax=Granulosicoccus sp. 3-233 TaxID=3417969 RepID=UPI003D32F708
MASLQIRNLIKDYGSFKAIRDVSLDVPSGEFVVMVGPSGCGKSTLLRSIAGLESVTSGEISIDGRDISRVEPFDRGVAMVFQNYALYPHMTVRQNMGFALKIGGASKAEVEAAVQRAAGILRIESQLDKKPKSLSGGQKQRVAIGRAITRSPDVFLFDEPLSNLDAALRSQMRVELGRLHAELGATMVYVTHDQTEAMTMASRIVVLRDGVIEQVGAPLELYNFPATRFVAGFLGSPRMNFIKASVKACDYDHLHLEAAGLAGCLRVPLLHENNATGNMQAGAEVIVGVRPEGFVSDDVDGYSDWRLEGRVAVVESLGRDTLLYLDCDGVRAFDSESHEGYFAIHRSCQLPAVHGQNLQMAVDPRATYVFDSSGATCVYPLAPNHLLAGAV